MAPATVIEPRSNGNQGGTIAIAVVISVGGAVILTFLLIVILLVWRRRKRTTNDLPYHGSAPRLRSQKLVNVSDASVNPLLIDKSRADTEEDYREKYLPQLPAFPVEDEVTRDDRDIVSDNPTGLYHMPSVQTLTPTAFSPTPSSNCLPYVLDIKNTTNLSPRIPTQRAPIPPSSPLVISDKPGIHSDKAIIHPPSLSRHPTAVDEEPLQPSRSVSSVSHYSQYSADSVLRTPPVTFAPLPLSQELGYDAAPSSSEDLHRGDTHLVGNLLKARARRNPDGLVRTDTHVSHIERTGSIKSIVSIRKDDRPYAKRYRSKKQRASQVGEMEVLREASEAASLRSRSDSTATQRDPNLLVKVPPHMIGPRPPSATMRKA